MNKDILGTALKSAFQELKAELAYVTRGTLTIVVLLAVVLSFFPWWVVIPLAFCAVVWLTQEHYADALNDDKDVDNPKQ